MTVSGKQIQTLVMRMQSEFLETAGLTLTPEAAAHRFGVDRAIADAVLTVLAEANVLARNREGAYTRFFPRLVGRGTRGAAPRRPARQAHRPEPTGFSSHAA